MNAYRDWRGRVHTFSEVDVTVMIETSVDEGRIGDGHVTERELLSLTVSFDHDVVDGAAAVRFVERLAELVESAHGVNDVAADL